MDNSDIEVFIVGEGVSGINQLLAQGWRIVGSVTFARIERGRVGTPDRSLLFMPYAPMGKKIAAGELADRVRAEAVAYSDAQQADAVLREDELLSDVPPLIDEDEVRSGYAQVAPDTAEPAPPIRRRQAKSIADVAAASVRE